MPHGGPRESYYPPRRGEGGLYHHLIALTIGFGFTEKRGHGIKIEEIQFAMITLSP
jgi:hypothetical protein